MFLLIGQAISSGLALGAIYALAASGLGIIFGLFGVINFAHTQNMMVAAVVAVTLNAQGVPYILSGLAGIFVAMALGIVIERLLIRPLLTHESAQIDTLFITLGLAIILENTTLLLSGAQPRYFQDALGGIISVAGIVVTADRLVAIAAAAVVFTVLYLVSSRTRIGHAMVAAAQNPAAARVIGLPVDSLRLAAFAVGCGLAGLAGVLWGTTYSVSYATGSSFLILSFVLVVMSGPGNIVAILGCSMLLGLTEALAGALVDAKWQRLAVMVVFVVVIVNWPLGLGRGRYARANI
jgi:branched-chain amino acid transport system permease protein